MLVTKTFNMKFANIHFASTIMKNKKHSKNVIFLNKKN